MNRVLDSLFEHGLYFARNLFWCACGGGSCAREVETVHSVSIFFIAQYTVRHNLNEIDEARLPHDIEKRPVLNGA